VDEQDARAERAGDAPPASSHYEPPAVDARTSSRDPLVWINPVSVCCP
jgi:hypothetical protein